jgi:hypothetical protein
MSHRLMAMLKRSAPSSTTSCQRAARLLHAGNEEARGDLTGRLRSSRILRRISSPSSAPLPAPDARSGPAVGTSPAPPGFDAVLVHSPRGAAILAGFAANGSQAAPLDVAAISARCRSRRLPPLIAGRTEIAVASRRAIAPFRPRRGSFPVEKNPGARLCCLTGNGHASAMRAVVDDEATGPDEPEPIDAEFEPASGPEPGRSAHRGAARPLRSRSATLQEMLIASVLASVLGASRRHHRQQRQLRRAEPGTLAREIDKLVRGAGRARRRAPIAPRRMWSSLRSRLDAQGERVSTSRTRPKRCCGTICRADQVSSPRSAVQAMAQHPAGFTTAGKSPLGILLGRINRLEGIVVRRQDRARQPHAKSSAPLRICRARSPRLIWPTTRWYSAFDRREAALAALETGMQTMADLTSPHARRQAHSPCRPAKCRTGCRPPRHPILRRDGSVTGDPRVCLRLKRRHVADRPFGASIRRLPPCCPARRICVNMLTAARTACRRSPQLRSLTLLRGASENALTPDRHRRKR